MNRFLLWCFSLTLLFVPALTEAATVTARMSGSIIYLEASELVDVAGMDLQFSFTPAKYTITSVVNGSLFSSGLIAPNFQQPGRIRIGIIQAQPVSGSGVIATIYGSQQGEGSIGIHSLRASGVATDGKAIPLQTRIVNLEAAAEPAAEEPASGETSNRNYLSPEDAAQLKAAKTAKANGTAGQRSADPTEQRRTQGFGEEFTQQRGGPSTPGKMVMCESALVTEGKYRQGVLQRFASYDGEKSAEKLLEMFTLWINESIPQEPAIKITNDKQPLRVTIAGMGKELNGLAIQGGKSVWQKSIGADVLELGIQTDFGVSVLKVILFDSSQVIDFPLTVAAFVDPDLNGDQSVDRKDLDLYLANRHHAVYDFDRSGETDYFDEYLYLMNYLSGQTHQRSDNAVGNGRLKSDAS